MNDIRIRLKNRLLAVVLAWLIPGAGHFYQGRRMKSAIYFCSIMGLWVMAMHLSEWKVMAAPIKEPGESQPMIVVLKFGAQSGVGLPAVAAVIQGERVKSSANAPVRKLDAPLAAEFIGEVDYPSVGEQVHDEARGTVSFELTQGQFGQTLSGRFVGETASGVEVDVTLGESASLGRPIEGDHRRLLTAQIVDDEGYIGDLRGTIQRPLLNWLFVPLNKQQELDLHRRLGKFHELATLLSVVAGLLNILAIFDAYGGPAYGYGDEEAPAQPEPAPATA